MAEAMGRGEPVEYGRWTLEELQTEGEYGRVFGILMENLPRAKSVTLGTWIRCTKSTFHNLKCNKHRRQSRI